MDLNLNRFSKSEKTAFLSAFFGGIIAHLYIYSNIIPNFDGLSRIYDEQQMTVSGRWFLHYVSYLHGFTQSPMVIGVLAMFFLAISAILTIRLLRIRNNILAGIWGIMSVVFPAVAYTNTFTFTVSAYFFSVLLAVTGVWVTDKWKWGFLGGSVLLALSMGTYQAYVTTAITLCIFLVLHRVLTEESKISDILWYSFRYVIFLGLGTVIYYVILKIFLKVKDLKLLSYLGMAEVEQGYPIDRLGTIITDTYLQIVKFLFQDNGYTNKLLVYLHILLFFISVFLLISLVIWRKLWKDKVKLVGVIILLVLLPIAVNFGQIISPYSAPSVTMQYSYVYLLLLPIMLIEKNLQFILQKSLYKAIPLIFTCSCLVITISHWEYDNAIYTMLNQAHRATLSFVTNVVSRVENCEGYQIGMDVVIVGGFPTDRYFTDIPIYGRVERGGVPQGSVIPLNKHIYYYMNDWINVPIEEPEEEVFIEVSESEEFLSMPLYPDDGSVKIINGRVVVKMQEVFTPKAQYEKDYENRR